MARVRINVSFELPGGATRVDALQYVVDAVSSWHGSLRPPRGYGADDDGDPMFALDSHTVVGSVKAGRDRPDTLVKCKSK